jgi:mannitol/fructose-specific phosphotransferase system IIA component (Ntr-type)
LAHRVFNLNEAASYLHLTRDDVELLVKRREIPFELQRERPVFRQEQIDAWASQRILGMQGRHVSDYHRDSSAGVRRITEKEALMPDRITTERIEPALMSRTKASAIRDMVALAAKTDLVCDPRDLLASIEAREELCSTAIAGGIALLHPRHHEPYMFADSFVVLGRTVQPIHAGSQDGEPTDLFFLICCPDDQMHLHILTRLCTMSLNTGLLKALRAAADAGAMLEAILSAEREIIGRL